MALTTVDDVLSLLSLIPELFDFTGVDAETDLEAIVTTAIDDADAWMQAYMGDNYGLTGPGEARVQAKAQQYLAASYLMDTLAFKKVVGTHFPYVSEESSEYERLIVEFEEKARGLLAKWVTIEVSGSGSGGGAAFAAPVFVTGPGIAVGDSDSEDVLMQAIADRARGFAKPSFGTVVGPGSNIG